MTDPVLDCRGVVRRFNEGASTLVVLHGVDLKVQPAERVAIIGVSGSGNVSPSKRSATSKWFTAPRE